MSAVDLVVAGRAESIDRKRDRFKSPALTAIRYADPASWITANAFAEAIAERRDAILEAHDRVAVIVNTAEGPVEAIAAMCEASKASSSSPIRFPASNPGSLAGVGSIAFGFRGPTLVLTMPAIEGAKVALLLAEAWLARSVADYVLIASAGALPATRCLVISSAATANGAIALDREADLAWLGAVPGAAPSEAR